MDMSQSSKPSSLTLVYMGDSITEGQYVDPALRWADLITEKLQHDFLETAVNLQCVNRGISGETTRQGLERYASDVQNHHANVMTLQFGLNDCNFWMTDRGAPRVSERAYRANLHEMIDRARRFHVEHIILSTNHQTLRHKVLVGGISLEEHRKLYNDIVREVADESDVTLCDIDEAFSHFSREEMADLLLPYPDLLHLSPAGHVHYSEYILPYIRKAIDDVLKAQS